MVKRKRGNTLGRWEISIIKAMLERGGTNDQDILSYFTRPTRSVNHRAIREIRTESRHKTIKAATQEELDEFFASWPDIDTDTGLSVKGDELLIKSREAMIAAVHTFNAAGLTFRAELFIVTAVIAWTYLLHAWFRREGIDYRYKNAAGEVLKTSGGAEKYWELSKCLKHARCPINKAIKQNLEFLLDIRHEIEHRSTDRIDYALSAKLQACCINFNNTLIDQFGSRYGLEHRLPIALQFSSFDGSQRGLLKKAKSLPRNLEAMVAAFHDKLTLEEQLDSRFAYRVIFVPKLANRASVADEAIEFVKADSQEARAANRVLLKEVDKNRYTATEIVQKMHDEGYPRFTMHNHTELWKALDAKNPTHNFGGEGLYANQWGWFDSWADRVRTHCEEHADEYRNP